MLLRGWPSGLPREAGGLELRMKLGFKTKQQQQQKTSQYSKLVTQSMSASGL